jgi:hypothetical protein
MDTPKKKERRGRRRRAGSVPRNRVTAKRLFPRVRMHGLDHGEHVEFHCRFREAILRHDLAEMEACEYYREYLARCSVEASVFHVIREALVTPGLLAGEAGLARMYGEFRGSLAALTRVEDPGVREKAARVIALMDNFGEIGGEDFASVSHDYGMIAWILRVYAPESLVRELGMLGALERFEEVNMEFRELVQERYRETMLFPGARLLASRTRTDKRFREVLQFIELTIMRDGAEAHPALLAFVQEVNELAAPYADRVTMKVKRKRLRQRMSKDVEEED